MASPLTAPDARRQPGLDTLRALAIVLVFAYHYRIFVSPQPGLGWPAAMGWVGVDLFFVLSGYLIGQQLLAGLVQGQPLQLGAFYARRALRTWPAFWLVLAAYFLMPSVMGGRPPPPLWAFLSFTQNIHLQPGTAFSHAWSLCIEEQFYAVLPLVLLLAVRIGAGRWQAWALLAVLSSMGISMRWWLWGRHGLEAGGQIDGYHPNIYYATWCRADEFLPGVALALLQHLHPAAWQRISAHGRALLVAGLATSALMLLAVDRWYYIDGLGYGFGMTVFGYSGIALAFALLVAAAISPGNGLAHLRVPGAAALARWSYAIYLSHKAVGVVVKAHVAPLLGGAAWADWALLLIDIAASLLVGAGIYRLVERPFMRLRQRWVPGSFA